MSYPRSIDEMTDAEIGAELMRRMGTPKHLDFRTLQLEVDDWATTMFGAKRPAWHQILGAIEEVGELAHAYLKREQGIRGTREEHTAAIRDAVADVIIYLADFACNEDFDLQDEVERVWQRVKNRDWKKNALHGGDVASHRELHPNESGEAELTQLDDARQTMPITGETERQLDKLLREMSHGMVGWEPEDQEQSLETHTWFATRAGVAKLARHGLAISDDGTVIDLNKVEEQQATEAAREAVGDLDIPF